MGRHRLTDEQRAIVKQQRRERMKLKAREKQATPEGKRQNAEQARKWRENNRGQNQEYMKLYMREYRRKNREKLKAIRDAQVKALKEQVEHNNKQLYEKQVNEAKQLLTQKTQRTKKQNIGE